MQAFLRRPCVFSRALVCGHAGETPVYHGASLGPGRAPWRVLWTFKVAKSGNHGVAFRGARAEQGNGKPTCQLFCSPAVKAHYFVAATVCNSSHTSRLCGPLLFIICVCRHCLRVCAVCGCVRVCVFVCWSPTFQLFAFFALFAAAVAASAVVSCLYHTVPQALKLSTLWQTRYNISVCVALPTTRVLTYIICVCSVCAMIHMRA